MRSRTGAASGLQLTIARSTDAPSEKLVAKEQYDRSSSQSLSDAQASIDIINVAWKVCAGAREDHTT